MSKKKGNKDNKDKNISERIESAQKSAQETVQEAVEVTKPETAESTTPEAAEAPVEVTKTETPPEDDEPAVPLTRGQKFFKVFDKFGDLFVLNIYFIVTCIPIITIGAAFTALYTVTNKMVNDKEGAIKDEYFKAFKANLKQGIAIWLIDLVVFYAMYLQYAYIILNDNQTVKYLYVILGFEFIVFAFAFPLQWPMVARYENTVWNLIRNFFIFALTNLGTWFRMFYIWLFPVVLYFLNVKIFVYTWFLWALILTSLFAYICSIFLVKFYDKLENPEKVQEETEELKKMKKMNKDMQKNKKSARR